METTTQTKTETKKENLRIPFCFKSNEFSNNNFNKVRSINSHGDGEIGSSGGKTTNACLVAIVGQIDRNNKVAITLEYSVREGDYAKNTKADWLMFQSKVEVDLSEFKSDKSTKDGAVTKRTVKSYKLLPTPRAIYNVKVSGQKHDFLKLGSNNIVILPTSEQQSWIPKDRLEFKIDDKGNELTKVGNFGVKGEILLPIEYAEIEYTITEVKKEEGQNLTPKTQGQFNVIPTIDPRVKSVLGRGYDITDEYCNAALLKAYAIDINEINRSKRLEKNPNSNFRGRTISGVGSQEVSESYNEKLNIKVSAGAFGVTFSNETSSTSSESKYEKAEYEFMKIMDLYNKDIYKVAGYNNSRELIPFLTNDFLNDLDLQTVNSGAEFVEKYGTHIILGMILGARLDYNMSRKKSTYKFSKAETFSSVTSISYGKSGEPKSEKKPKASKVEELFTKAIKEDGLSKLDLKELFKQAHELDNKNSGASKEKSSGSGSGFSISASASYSTDWEKSIEKEEESTKIECTGTGGDEMLIQLIKSNPNNYDKWRDSIKESNYKWADYIPGTLIPIYTLVPKGKKLSAEQVKKAWEEKLKGKIPQLSKGLLKQNITLMGNKRRTVKVEESEDADVGTKDNRTTGWNLRLEPVNFANGTIGLAIALTVGEDGLHGGKTKIVMRETIELNAVKNNMAVGFLNETVFQTEGTINRKEHGWFEVTSLFKKCPFIDTMSKAVKIRVDGGGEDYNNLGVELTTKIPYIYADNIEK